MTIEEILALLKGVKDGDLVAISRAEHDALMAAAKVLALFIVFA